MAFYRMTLSQAAVEVLSTFGEPLSLDEIYTRIVTKNLFQFDSTNPKQTLGRILGENCRDGSSEEVLFYRTPKKTFGLVEWEPKSKGDPLSNFIPPRELFEYLLSVYPIDNDIAWLNRIDNTLLEDGDLKNVVYKSTIFYLLRRLVTRAKKKAEIAGAKKGHLKEDSALKLIRDDIKKFGFADKDIEKISWLLRECVKASKHTLPRLSTKKLLRDAKKRGLRCYICGSELDYERKNSITSAEIEHIWPKSLRGSNTDNNLAISCRKCNQGKEDVLGSEDFHYEHIALGNNSLKYQYKLSIILKNECACSICSKKSQYVKGGLSVVRKNKDDFWHYLNLQSVCLDHLEE